MQNRESGKSLSLKLDKNRKPEKHSTLSMSARTMSGNRDGRPAPAILARESLNGTSRQSFLITMLKSFCIVVAGSVLPSRQMLCRKWATPTSIRWLADIKNGLSRKNLLKRIEKTNEPNSNDLERT